MVGRRSAWVFIVLLCALAAAATEEGLVAHWDFNEGAGSVLHDRSGNGNDGKIIEARWVKVGTGSGLQFGRTGSYVDFGDNATLKLSGDCSFAAWIKLTADPYPDRATNWHLFLWEVYQESGATLRLEGSTGQVYFRSNQAKGTFQHGLSDMRLANQTFYHVALVKKGEKAVLFVDGRRDSEFDVKDPSATDRPFTLSHSSQSFAGVMDDVRLYGRALSDGDLAALYLEGGAEHQKDVSWLGVLKLTPFIYDDEDRALVEADFRGVLPLQEGERIVVELRPTGKPPVEVREQLAAADSGRDEYAYDLKKLPPGAYDVCVAIRGQGKTRVEQTVRFNYPAAAPRVPAPAERVVAPQAASPATPPYALDVGEGGGFTLRLGDETYPVESVYSYPLGGENLLTASARSVSAGEKEWRVQREKIGDSTYSVVATGKHYRITREIAGQATRILVTYRIENLTAEDLGIAVDNRIDLQGKKDVATQAPASPAPPLFVSVGNLGIGLVPLNDVYQFLQRTYIETGSCGAKIAGLGIPKGGSHTLEWAVYPVGAADYFDLVNAIRRDEGLNGMTVDGCLAVSHSGRWQRDLPPDELIRYGGVTDIASGCLMRVADDPGISFEGIEFVRYPKEREALTKNYAEIKKRFPGLKVGFHVAYNIYATDQPDQAFPDARVLAASGKHEMYGNFEGYFSPERRAQGWAWYPYYPTLANSFGKELLQSVDVMMDEMGAGMVWADGLLSGYGANTGNFPTSFVSTLEPWDGHSVELDPATRTISRKWGQVAALGEDALIEYIRQINAKGGRVWINHMHGVPRSFVHEKAYWAAETNDGDFRVAALHLSPTPHGLANPNKCATAQMVYDDIRAKLSWGALYVYYWYGGASQLTHKMLTAEMYPITIEELHAGYIKGSERLITTHSGVYGWPQSQDLPISCRFDAKGRIGQGHFLTTVERAGVRTEIVLGDRETAVLKRVPVTLHAPSPVNVVFETYAAAAVLVTLNGSGAVELCLRDGDFRITPGATYVVNADAEGRAVAAADGILHVGVTLRGQMRLGIAPAAGP
jgi:hypothetical protein